MLNKMSDVHSSQKMEFHSVSSVRLPNTNNFSKNTVLLLSLPMSPVRAWDNIQHVQHSTVLILIRPDTPHWLFHLQEVTVDKDCDFLGMQSSSTCNCQFCFGTNDWLEVASNLFVFLCRPFTVGCVVQLNSYFCIGVWWYVRLMSLMWHKEGGLFCADMTTERDGWRD